MSSCHACFTRLHRRQYNPIFEFENCSMMGQSVSMKITSVTGHLMELEFAEPYGKKWGACQPVELFTAPLIRYVKDVRSQDTLLLLQFQLRNKPEADGSSFSRST